MSFNPVQFYNCEFALRYQYFNMFTVKYKFSFRSIIAFHLTIKVDKKSCVNHKTFTHVRSILPTVKFVFISPYPRSKYTS